MKIAETILWLAGVILLALYFGARGYGDLEARQGIAQFEQAREHVASGAIHRDPAEMPVMAEPQPAVLQPDQSDWAEYRVRLFERDRVAANEPPVAVLRVPRADIAVPVYRELTERNLNRGVAWIAGTAPLGVAGNVGIAGHRDSFFRGLQHVAIGDVIEVDGFEESRAYRVTELSVVEPTDVGVLDPTDARVITLVTCYPFYFAGHAPQRYIVRAEAI